MTYGENSEQIRESLAWLLGRHRILQQLGGQGSHTMPPWSTEAQRERMGQVIQRYRLAGLTWCLEAVTASIPQVGLQRRHSLVSDSAERLRDRLAATVGASGPAEPLSRLLASRHHNGLLDAWQRVARAAALGEHDFGAGVNRDELSLGGPGRFSRTQRT